MPVMNGLEETRVLKNLETVDDEETMKSIATLIPRQ